jgi:serine/threonine protein kinase
MHNLSDANKIVLGIALVMRCMHSRKIIHRELKPDSILLDWDLKVRIADFRGSTSPEDPKPPSRTGADPNSNWAVHPFSLSRARLPSESLVFREWCFLLWNDSF